MIHVHGSMAEFNCLLLLNIDRELSVFELPLTSWKEGVDKQSSLANFVQLLWLHLQLRIVIVVMRCNLQIFVGVVLL